MRVFFFWRPQKGDRHLFYPSSLLFLLLITLCTLLSTPTRAADTQPATTNYAIIVDPSDTPPVQSAALGLQKVLTQQLSQNIPILPTTKDIPAATHTLIVGPKAALTADPTLAGPLSKLGPESFLLLTPSPTQTLVAGGHPRGTLYAGVTLLHDNGCRWWSPTASTIPKTSSIPRYDPKTSHIRGPAFEYRDVYYLHAFDPKWALHNRTNGTRTNLPPHLGGSTKSAILVHSFYKILPPETYFKSHPQWYSLLNNARTSEKAQLCLTNPDMLQEFIKNTRTLLNAKPDATTLSISQNDWAGNCTCPDCKAIDDAEGSPSGNILRFTNAVATALKTDFPHITFTTLAYEYSVAPPRITRPAPNVAVFVCTIRAGFEKPITSQPTRPVAAQIKEWSRIAPVYVWDYLPNFSHLALPHPNLYVQAPNLRFYRDSGVKGVLAQGIYNTPGSELAELRAWLVAQLLWNPDQDTQSLINEFASGYYGPAAPAILKYIALHQTAIESFDGKLTLYSRPNEKYLTLDLFLAAWQSLQEAQALASSDPTGQTAQRVATAQLPLRYLFIMRHKDFTTQAATRNLTLPPELAPPNTLPDLIADFKTRAAQSGLNRIYENKPGFSRLDELLLPPKPTP